MRLEFTIVFIFLIVALAACAFMAYRSHKAIGKSVAMLCAALIPPVLGNLILVRSYEQIPAAIGCYIYFIGMDIVMYALIRFACEYCAIPWHEKKSRILVLLLLEVDVMQLLFNPRSGHAFGSERIMVEDKPYWLLVPHLGQSFHRIVCYGILLAVVVIFVVKLIRSPRIYSERYSFILLTLVAAGIWQTYYIFSRTPIDRSMIGFGAFGLMIFYFALYYRPMRLLDRMLSGIASEMPEALYFFDTNSKCIWANSPALELLGLSEEELDETLPRLNEMFGTLEHQGHEWSMRHVIGSGSSAQYFQLEKHVLTDESGHDAGKFLTIRDNTADELRLQKEIYNATHDSLTDLFTREYLYECIRKTVLTNNETKYLVAFLDVKNFKIVNDIFSNAFGDYALQCIADWIRGNVPESCVFGRLGGDTFGLCMPVADFNAAELEEKLSQLVVEKDAVVYHLLIHVGVYEINNPEVAVSVMFDRAHLALSTIKDEYQTHVAFYDQQIRDKVLWDQHISSQLRQAISERQMCPYLQPIVDRAGKVVGAEALARWLHPEDGFLPPGRFIPVFEKNGMIVEVDRYMWRCACEILSRWGDALPEMFISVNISPKDFYFMDVIAEIKSLIAEYGIAPERLRIEITETVMMNDAEDRMKILQQFRDAGFIVEMDDFGSGYSSLNLLKDMPVDVLKIDMKFLSKTDEEQKAQTIVRNVLNLSEDLGMESLTEGVETEAQYHMLSDMGCKLFQGYHFAKPMPVDEFERFCS